MKQKALAVSLALAMVAGVSCDSPVRPATTGSINLILVSPTNGAQVRIAAPGEAAAASDLTTDPNASTASVTLTSVRVTVSGPTNKTVTTTTASGGFFDVSVDGLTPGSYSVVVEGIVGTEVADFGQTSGVSVTAGASSTATVTFASFQPVIPASTVVDTVDVLRFTVNYGAVASATGYVVAWSKNADMSSAQTKAVTGTSTEIQVTDEAKYWVTVRAVNPVVTSGGAASPTKAVFVFQGVATVTVTPATPTIAIGATQTLTAEARDADNNVVPNVTWLWLSSNQAAATVSQLGVATGVGAGTTTITAVGKGMPGSTNVTVSSVNVASAKLAFSIQPTNATAGDAISPAIQVEVQDAGGNRVSSSREAITIAFANNAGGGTLTGTKTVNAINGIASFTGVWINKAASGYTLSATSGSLTSATSSGFQISAAAPAKLNFAAQPTTTQGNVAMPAVTVQIVDQFDNPTSASNSVTVAVGNNLYKTPFATGGTISGTVTAAASAGVATFNTLKIDKPSPGYTLTASSGTLTGATSSAFNVTLPIAQMAPGKFSSAHTCAVTTAATPSAYCWGLNGNSQLGAATATVAADSVAALVRGGLSFVQVTAGYRHSCGITVAGAAYCWGYNAFGQLGDNSQTQRAQPVAVGGGHVFAQISAGIYHTCGVTTSSATDTENRQVWCWGYDYYGQLGDAAALPGAANQLLPIRAASTLPGVGVGLTYASISAGAYHACAVTRTDSPTNASKIYCWGYDYYGQLGDNSTVNTETYRNAPFLVTGAQTWSSVSAGYYHTCAVTTTVGAGNAYCWGNDGNGQLGDDITLLSKSNPTQVSGGATWSSAKAGGLHSCGVTTGGTGFCWGYNQYGQLGNGTSGQVTGLSQDQAVPVQTGLGLTWSVIEPGEASTCGLVGTNMYCWGLNSSGQLGTGDRQTAVPQVKESPTQIVQ